MFLSNSFLLSSDPRQHDAIICVLLETIRRVPHFQARVQRFSRAVLLCFLGLIVFMILTGGIVLGDAALGSLLLVITTPLLGLVGLVLYFRAIRRLRMHARQITLDADRAAAELTGDPYAVMAAIHTVLMLNGRDPITRSLTACPSTAERIAALDRWLHETGAQGLRVPEPVPSIAPVYAGGRLITTPITPDAEEEQISTVPASVGPLMPRE
jgi:hypothetical protein